MASLMGMNRYFADEGLRGLGNAAALQTQRENAKTQMEAAQDATKKGTMSSLAGSGAMLGYAAPASILGGSASTGAGAVGATAATTAGTTAATTAATTAGTTAVAAGGAAAGAETGAIAGTTLGPMGAVAGLAVGALAGWLFSEFM
ncbi:hypothetical protein UFOVP1419_40 [uncultured Caudovirales phage]|uniref:Uncharacterized protein n=1 Tax=uncultured Caudovirales phage TaxID=2100421 RepID=A0A6J5SE26_9CAUD|nr:hypothetical protein UFOVP1419_40 [uncultured Caudovirales phage]